MNVLPVLVEMSPSIKTDSSFGGTGSSIGEFARLLDRTISGSSDRSGPTSAQLETSYTPPTAQDVSTQHAQDRSNAGRDGEGEVAPSTDDARKAREHGNGRTRSSAEAPSSDGSRTAGASGAKDTRSKHTGTSEGAASSGQEEGKQNLPGVRVKGTVADSKKTGSATSGNAKVDKKHTTAEVGAAANGLIGPALIAGLDSRNGADRTAAVDSRQNRKVKETAHAEATGKSGAVPTGGREGAQAEVALKAPDAKAGEKSKHPENKQASHPKMEHASAWDNVQIAGSPQPSVAQGGPSPMPAQLGTVVVTAAGQPDAHPNAQGVPVASHHGVEGQNPGVTIVDLRHAGQSQGQNPDPGHYQQQDGANIRLFQVADGGSTPFSRVMGQGPFAPGAAAQGHGFAALTDQIVKQTGILLKDNNSGEIRLVLKPENLGSLRIKIDMSNSTLTGKIFVQNHDALRLVQQNLDSLYRALKDSGFTATSLNVSVGGRDGGDRERHRSSPLPLGRTIVAASGFDRQASPLEAVGSGYSFVNLVI